MRSLEESSSVVSFSLISKGYSQKAVMPTARTSVPSYLSVFTQSKILRIFLYIIYFGRGVPSLYVNIMAVLDIVMFVVSLASFFSEPGSVLILYARVNFASPSFILG